MLQWSGRQASLHLPQLFPVVIFIDLIWRRPQARVHAACRRTCKIQCKLSRAAFVKLTSDLLTLSPCYVVFCVSNVRPSGTFEDSITINSYFMPELCEVWRPLHLTSSYICRETFTAKLNSLWLSVLEFLPSVLQYFDSVRWAVGRHPAYMLYAGDGHMTEVSVEPGLRVTGHRVNDFGWVGSGHGSVCLTRFL